MKKGVILLVIFSLIQQVSALGVLYWHGPHANFQPGMTLELNYVVHGLPPTQEVRVFAEGDLAQYVDLSPDVLKGGGGFTAILRLPQEIEKPGDHVIYFVVSEVAAGGGNVGTAVVLQIPFTISVPFPGKYANALLKVEDVNIGELLEVTIEGTNLGTEDNFITASLDIFSVDKVGGFDLGGTFVKSQEKFLFHKRIETREYKPGNYNAVALVDYGSPLRLEKAFRIGSLFVSITNSTSFFKKDAINPFHIEVESRWNNLMEEVYAEVKILNATQNITSFKTPSEQLERWSKKILTGFFDTQGLSGYYDADIRVVYSSGKKSGETTKRVKILVQEESFMLYAYLAVGGALILLVVGICIVIFKKKRRKERVWRRRR